MSWQEDGWLGSAGSLETSHRSASAKACDLLLGSS